MVTGKIMQHIRITSGPPTRIHPVQMNIYQSNTYKEDLRWPYFDDEPSVQERQQELDQQSYIPVSVAHLTYPSSS